MPSANRQWLLDSRPVGMLREADFRLVEAPLPCPGDGEVLVRVCWLSFDPAMRGWLEDRPSYLPPVGIGEPMRAAGVGQITQSRHAGFRPGQLVQGMFGWQDYAVARAGTPLGAVPIPPGVPPTWVLGVLGVTGLTAWFGLLDVGRPVAGETVVVSGAAGATGSVAAQLARVRGCRAIGIAGGADKCRWLVEEARLDAAIDYKSENVSRRLAELCPKGIDVFFDNVGGEILDAALARLALRGRVVLCGGISRYNEKEPSPGPRNYLQLVVQRGRMEGFIVLDYLGRFGEAAVELARLVAAGEIVHREDVQEGLENAPRTLLRLFDGRNTGKQLLHVADPPLAIA